MLPTRVLRVVVLALLLLSTSGIAWAASLGDDGTSCVSCGLDCKGDCDGRSCPPGPLCPDAPAFSADDVVLVVASEPTVCIHTLEFPHQARPDGSEFHEDVFHPPRSNA